MNMRIVFLAACASTLAVSVFIGTAPAKADGWDYAWYSGRCYMTFHPNGSNPSYLNLLPNPPYWRSATNDRCSNIPRPATKIPFALKTPAVRQPRK